MITILTVVFCALSVAFNITATVLVAQTRRNLREVERLRSLR